MNYEKFRYGIKDIILEFGFYCMVCGAVSYVFYKSFMIFALTMPIFPIYLKIQKKKYIHKRKGKLLEEFAESLQIISANLKAGYSVENAFIEAYKDVIVFFKKESLMAAELLLIRKGLEVNRTLEEMVEDFALRSNVEDILLFADALKMAKRNGGNIREVLLDTADIISEKICTDKEIELIISEKKLEFRIMEAVPLLLPVYLEATSKGYFDVLYEGIFGRMFMTSCLIVYVVAIIWGDRILRIDV